MFGSQFFNFLISNHDFGDNFLLILVLANFWDRIFGVEKICAIFQRAQFRDLIEFSQFFKLFSGVHLVSLSKQNQLNAGNSER